MSRGVAVLGMHRSGTSAVAGALRLLGLEPVADDFLPADEANPRGYWESASLVALNDEILDALGYAWDDPPPAPGWSDDPAVRALAESLQPRLAGLFPRDGWIWKDPRTALTLPVWLRAAAIDPVVVLVHRDPLEVAGSLAARDGMDETRGLALWERYVRHALAAASGRPTFVCAYTELVDDPLAWQERVGAFLAEHGVAPAAPEGQAAAGFIDRALRRARPCGDASPVQRELVRVLDGLRGPHSPLARVALPDETVGLDGVLARARRDELRAARTRAAALEAALAETRASRSFRYTAPIRWLAARVPGA